MEITEILKKLRAITESEDKCSNAQTNKFCPVHGFGGCPVTEDDDLEDEDTDDLEDEDTDDLEDEDTDDLEDEDTDDRSVDDDVNVNDKAKIKAKDDEYYNEIINGNVPEDVVEPDRFMRYYKKTYHIKEDVHITLDGQEADAFIQRLSVLAGQTNDDLNSENYQNQCDSDDTCSDCGNCLDQCTCDQDDTCSDCGNCLDQCTCNQDDTCLDCGNCLDQCECDKSTEAMFGPDGVTLENADHDFGDQEHPDSGEPVDPNAYMYKASNGEQRLVKGFMGDNPLIKENAEKLFAKLKGDYKSYVAEADMAASNAPGSTSPLTANNRDEFDKDPFVSDEAVTDGSRSPLSTIKRQKVLK